MTCLTCHHGALRDSTDAERDKYLRRMAKLGFVNCTRSPLRATFKPLDGGCKRFQRADEATVEARQRWAASLSAPR